MLLLAPELRGEALISRENSQRRRSRAPDRWVEAEVWAPQRLDLCVSMAAAHLEDTRRTASAAVVLPADEGD